MFRGVGLILCVFLTSAFNSAWADYCFENTNPTGVMSRFICFKEISILNLGSGQQKLRLLTKDIDETYAIQKWEVASAGFLMSSKGDYINYAENCGLTLLSQFEMRAQFTSKGKYIHDSGNTLIIKYKYTNDRCTQPSISGTEHYTPKP